MKLHNLRAKKTTGYTTWGCMWESGRCRKDTAYVCHNEEGVQVPMQSRITAYWPDGSVKWTAHTADSALLGNGMEVEPVCAAEAEQVHGTEQMYGMEQAHGTKHMKGTGQMQGTERMHGTEQTHGTEQMHGMEQMHKREAGICLEERETEFILDNGLFQVVVPKGGDCLIDGVIAKRGGCLTDEMGLRNEGCRADEVQYGEEKRICRVTPVLLLEQPELVDGNPAKVERRYCGAVKTVELEEQGELQCIIKYTGCHRSASGEEKLPFVIRLRINAGSEQLHFSHTFLYDGDEDRDFLKGLGIVFRMPMKGKMYNRHIRVLGDNGSFHESAVQLISWRPRVPAGLYERQMNGELLRMEGQEQEIVEKILQDTPYWNTYDICQDSVSHFAVRKKLAPENCCYIDCLHGERAAGGMAVGSEAGSVLVSIRDFWEKYPSGYTVTGLDSDMAEGTIWFWSPSAPVMDFRHYANRGYNQVCYEGYDYKGATPVGIACTNECMIALCGEMIPSEEKLKEFTAGCCQPPQYVGTPEFYHQMKAFGYWSLPCGEKGNEESISKASPGEVELWLEQQLEEAFSFYRQEVEQRNWYGMFNYGDFMHTYDGVRHQWRYDCGGYAWDNTELVPTLWLWLYFMRTGREEVFTLAEKLSRHASEVDVYHMGKYKGLGSRHNVRHWGCPCKEARIAMAAHHRFYYYLTGDRRMEDIFEELKDNEMSFLNKDPLGDFYEKKDMVYPSHARSGPDWSSLCSNWMTRWERFQDERYRDKIITGIEDIKKAPLKLVSGPDFEFDPQTCHLRYIGERTTGGCHLQVCMGAPQVWMELADLLEDEEWKEMLAQLGRFYYLPREEQLKESEGLIGEREFTLPFMAAAMGAYGAAYLKDKVLAKRTWRILLQTLISEGNHDGFAQQQIPDAGNQRQLQEIPWISTNFAAQFCLNVIVVLEFIREDLPRSMKEAEELVAGMDEWFFRKA